MYMLYFAVIPKKQPNVRRRELKGGGHNFVAEKRNSVIRKFKISKDKKEVGLPPKSANFVV
jgi:hypothetical protein